jgi:hypothetical protein
MKRAIHAPSCSLSQSFDARSDNQERELRQVAERMGCNILKVYKDHGVNGAK